jgi:hypothetical protein
MRLCSLADKVCSVLVCNLRAMAVVSTVPICGTAHHHAMYAGLPACATTRWDCVARASLLRTIVDNAGLVSLPSSFGDLVNLEYLCAHPCAPRSYRSRRGMCAPSVGKRPVKTDACA